PRRHHPGHAQGDRHDGSFLADEAPDRADRRPGPARRPERGERRPHPGVPRRGAKRRRVEPEEARVGRGLPGQHGEWPRRRRRGRGRGEATGRRSERRSRWRRAGRRRRQQGPKRREAGRDRRRGAPVTAAVGALDARAQERSGAVRPATAASALRANGLEKSFGRRKVLKSVSIDVHPGEVVGLLGPNGAGKTTTFYCVVGLARPDVGTITLGDQDLTDLPMFRRARAGISYLPQEPSVFRGLTVAQNIMAILETLPLTREVRRNRLDALLDELSIAH